MTLQIIALVVLVVAFVRGPPVPREGCDQIHWNVSAVGEARTFRSIRLGDRQERFGGPRCVNVPLDHVLL